MRRDPRLTTILLVVLVQMIGASLIMPILPLLAKNEYGMSPQSVTLLSSTFFAAQFIASPFFGRLSDKIGRVPVLLVSQAGTAVSFVILAFAPSVGWLFVGRILDGITGGSVVVAQAYVTDITPAAKRAQSLGMVMATFGISFAVGPALGGLLSTGGLRLPYLVAAVAAITATFLTWRILDESLSAEERATRRRQREKLSLGMVLGNRTLVITLALGFLAMFVLGQIISTFALIGEAYWFSGIEASRVSLGIGLLLTVTGVTQFFTQTRGLPRVLERFGDAGTAVLGTLVRGVGLAMAIARPSWALAAVGCTIYAFGGGITQPPAQAIATRTLPDRFRGGVLGLYQSVGSVGTIISTAIGGTLFARSPTLPWTMAAVLSVCASVPAMLLLKRPEARPDVVADPD